MCKHGCAKIYKICRYVEYVKHDKLLNVKNKLERRQRMLDDSKVLFLGDLVLLMAGTTNTENNMMVLQK